MNNYALEISDLRKVYSGGTEALKGISLKVKDGDFYALLGPNGAGKSSTIGIIGTLVTKTSGSVKIFNNDIDANVSAAKSILGVVSQEINFSQFEKVIDIVTTQAGYYGITKSIAKPKVKNMLKRLGLWDKRNDQARTLSGGYKRRLMIAKALIHDPKLLILDEPTAGVDIELRREMWDFLKEINKNGTTIILTTHYLEEAEKMCDRIGILNEGNLVALDSTQNLLNKIKTKKVIFNLDKPINVKNYELESLKVLSSENNKIIFSYEKNKIKIEEIIKVVQKNNVKIIDISTDDGDLEEIFLELTKNK